MDKDLHESLVEALKAFQAKPKEEGKGVGKLLNAPFTLTVLGGLLLAIVSGLITHWSGQNARQLEIALEKTRQKQAFVNTFSTQLQHYLELTLSVRKREIFLHDWQAQPDRETVKYPDGRNFIETRAAWEEEKRYWLTQAPSSALALVYTAKMLFHKPETIQSLDRLYKVAEDYGQAATYADLENAYYSTLDQLEDVTQAMAKEAHDE